MRGPGVAAALCLAAAMLPAAAGGEPAPAGRITGRLEKHGTRADGMVAFFDERAGPPPDFDRYFRVPTESAFADAAGRFEVALPAGRYYVAAIRRTAGQRLGPPARGDLVFQPRDRQGAPLLIVVTPKETTDLGVLTGPLRYQPRPPRRGERVTAIAGTVVGEHGKARAGVVVLAYRVGGTELRPLFASDPTGRDGRFALRLPEGGRFWLRVRTGFREGPPQPGSLLGGHGDAPVEVAVRTGATARGTVVRIADVRPPGRRGPRGPR
ncbi:MAG TPA: hypothetical protein VGQ83_43080 [Polyangia bacterium]|jgi:hypothetical protein